MSSISPLEQRQQKQQQDGEDKVSTMVHDHHHQRTDSMGPKDSGARYPGQILNHNGKPMQFLQSQSYAPSKINYIGANLDVHCLVRALFCPPKLEMPIVSELIISVLVYCANTPGAFKVFVMKGQPEKDYAVVLPEIAIPIPTGTDDGRQCQDFGGSLTTTIVHRAYQISGITGAESLSEMDCVLFPAIFGEHSSCLRAIAMLKCTDDEGVLQSRSRGNGTWMTEETIRTELHSITGGVTMRREMCRGFKILEDSVHDPQKELERVQPVDEKAYLARLVMDARNEMWKPTFGPVRFYPPSYNSVNCFLGR